MPLRPILKSLVTHHKTAATLIILEIAVTCAIICNAAFLIGQRWGRMHRTSGVAESELSRVQFAGIRKGIDPVAQAAEDLQTLRAIPGVKSVSVTNELPFGNSSWNTGLTLHPDDTQSVVNATMYFDDGHLLDTLGLRLIAGRDFRPDEVTHERAQMVRHLPGQIIVTRALAGRLFPGTSGIGKTFYFGKDPVRIIGVVDHLTRPNEGFEDPTHEYSLIIPIGSPGEYVLRTAPEDRARVLGAAVTALEKRDPSRVLLRHDTLEEMRAAYFRPDRAMAWLLVTVCVALLIVTALGIIGLASFWVQQRTRQIGVRRALGATRGQILRHFQSENLLLTTAGIALGMALAFGINLWLMKHYALPRLPMTVLPAGAVTLWLLGQLAVWGPARRASLVPPAVATRSV